MDDTQQTSVSASVDHRSGCDLTDLAYEMRARGDSFAIATVVRTVSVTAAKPGAKAIIDSHGRFVDGWIGGGCAKSAVTRAAMQAIKEGTARLLSIQPEELLKDLPQEQDEQLVTALNMCPSRGSMDIFIEPVVQNPELLVIGSSPVAESLAALAPAFDLNVRRSENTDGHDVPGAEHATADDRQPTGLQRYIIVSTQGSGDLKSLEFALSQQSCFIGFVGSSRKIQHLRGKLVDKGFSRQRVEQIKSPAGLDIHAVTPQEIALSVIAEIVILRRKPRSV
ncbi:MAG: XdhC family protein [Granulosicoccus sp.]